MRQKSTLGMGVISGCYSAVGPDKTSRDSAAAAAAAESGVPMLGYTGDVLPNGILFPYGQAKIIMPDGRVLGPFDAPISTSDFRNLAARARSNR